MSTLAVARTASVQATLPNDWSTSTSERSNVAAQGATGKQRTLRRDGWTVISMKSDWKRIFSFEPR